MTSPSPTGPSATGVAPQVLRTVAIALLGAPVMLLVVVAVVLPPGDDTTYPPTALALGLLVPVLLGLLAAEAIGFRATPLDPSQPLSQAEATRVSMGELQRLTLLRFVATEVPLLTGVATAFLLPEHAFWPYVIVLLPGLLVMVREVWPSRRVVDRTATALEARGGRSYLREAFGHA